MRKRRKVNTAGIWYQLTTPRTDEQVKKDRVVVGVMFGLSIVFSIFCKIVGA